MPYYKTGTVSLTNGSDIVTAEAGANWTTAQVRVGDGFIGPNNTLHEIVEVVSPSQLRLARPYVGAGGGGQSYAIQPSQAPIRDLYTAVNSLVVEYRGIADGPGQGIFADGSAAQPGMRFASDQDTGWRRIGNNAFSLVAGGIDKLVATNTGVGIGTFTPGRDFDFRGGNGSVGDQVFGRIANVNKQRFCEFGQKSDNGTRVYIQGYFGDSEAEAGQTAYDLLLNPDGGNLLVGAKSGSCHAIKKDVGQGTELLSIFSNQGSPNATFYGGATFTSNAADTVLRLSSNSATGRSISTPGTINASGADYAEYVRKSDGCGAISKGDACGIDRNGRLTRSWAEAVSYIVKSTDPNMVGGDNWGGNVGLRPEEPAPLGPRPSEPAEPVSFAEPRPERADDESEGEFAVRVYQWEQARDAAAAVFEKYVAAMDAYPAALAEWMTAERAHVAATADHEAALAEWEAAFEAERKKVDRIAFCGIVPVNVSDEVLAECEAALNGGERVYLVAVANGGGIGVKAVRKSAMTLADHLDRLGPVWRIEDGRPIIDVQHG